MHYDYHKSAAYSKQIGLTWSAHHVENFDQMAKAHGFTQAQVDIALQHHLWNVRQVMVREHYGMRKRIALALYYLFGCGSVLSRGKK